MAKKTKGKHRLDKFYFLAKEQGCGHPPRRHAARPRGQHAPLAAAPPALSHSRHALLPADIAAAGARAGTAPALRLNSSSSTASTTSSAMLAPCSICALRQEDGCRCGLQAAEAHVADPHRPTCRTCAQQSAQIWMAHMLSMSVSLHSKQGTLPP